ncbi:hypothetical protein A0H81_04041 [Grifola frondosa]|uniref:Uncharacterized protein n=1 Tax=Grifola frondosa TaxID=5627 RepID=A0A1C7MIG4_GRIFR|nr:hypothetical protein A0H81_04041 [Grifola frondosa]
MFFLLLLSLVAAVPSVLADSSLRILHRVSLPNLQEVPYVHRATLHVSGAGPATAARLVPSETLADDLTEFMHTADGANGALYQVALEHPGDTDQTQWSVSAVLACHMPRSTSESLTFHLAPDGTPFSLDYFIAPVPHDGACPKKPRSTKAGSGLSSSPVEYGYITNSSVLLRSPTFPPLPQLRVPPPVTAEGKPVEPVPEKSFIEKYWMYIAIALVAMVLAPSAPEEEGGGRPGPRGGASGQ